MIKSSYAVIVAAALAGLGTGITFASHAVQAAGAPANAMDDPATKVAARLGITAYEKEGQAGGCGAPEKVLVDNDVVRVNLVSFPKDFVRCGHVKRRNHQLLVYIDPGDFTLTWNGVTGENQPPPKEASKPLQPGSIAFHPKESLVSDSHINNAYRVIFVEMKK